ncbi:hypothetical protein FC26_GL000460 [Paucilactobacillus vaccinostercus DSM 20634]|uniref:YxeA family protein n=2 Tax=Paucilactobacillus vaccinostercus TaxID=176291 RepID=A0A0R2AD33_9LACO|nr:hypothetical protein FC26_GL000460 [Paucilactobacillus vaccinostercus DSM 20634]
MLMKKKWVWIIVAVVVLIGGALAYQKYHGVAYYARVGNVASQRTDKNAGKTANQVRTYRMVGYNKQGAAKHLSVQTFNSQRLAKGHYLKVTWSAAKGVKSYERVAFNQIPQAAQQKLD